ncbi:SpoIIIAH-like family protein [Bacillus timonensis]|nr:SpoIIIAH-like family protein [Bacillus timonensis]
MLLKKQTVWLLTMLSLVVVLSVYYITAPEGTNNENVAFDQNGVKEDVATNAEGKDGEVSIEETEDGTVISAISSDELFTALRMQIEEERSRLRDDLQEIVASAEVSADDKSRAYEQMRQLSELAAKESIIETLIKSKGYEDALVRADGDKVRITVKAKEHTASAANEIMQLVRSELGELQDVAVTFEPAE